MITVIGLLLAVSSVAAQGTETQGKLAGAVYTDVNGDGVCVGTGVAGENPVPGVEVVFVSSDKATVISLTTGNDGTYGLADAGQSIWEVTTRPDASKWIVTSKNPLFVPVLPDTGLVQTDVNFCISQGGANAVIVLPQSGAAAANDHLQTGVVVTAVIAGKFSAGKFTATVGGVVAVAVGGTAVAVSAPLPQAVSSTAVTTKKQTTRL